MCTMICVFVCVYVYIYIYTRITYIYIYICTYVYTPTYCTYSCSDLLTHTSAYRIIFLLPEGSQSELGIDVMPRSQLAPLTDAPAVA